MTKRSVHETIRTLITQQPSSRSGLVRSLLPEIEAALQCGHTIKTVWERVHQQDPTFSRSEERRVGKECRSRCDWSSDVCSSDLGLVRSLLPEIEAALQCGHTIKTVWERVHQQDPTFS